MSLASLFRTCLVLSLLLTARATQVHADGSKDLYPRSVKGNRAFLVSRAENTANNNFAFPTRGTHYVYVKAGETLAVASSAVYMGEGDIEVTKPGGGAPLSCRAQPYNEQNNIGLIRNKGYGTREAELAGPGVGYDAWEIPVASGEEGIWRIDFYAPDRTTQSGDTGYPPEIAANANWQQTEHYCIAAWDVSVRNNNGWISGRVFTNVLSLQINPGLLPNNRINLANANGAFYGVNYVLTNDGYVYKVDGNGSNGLAFTYFVNNKGFLDDNKQPIYKSLPSIREVVNGAVHDPREKDTDQLVTHKIMYTKPDMTMPEEATGIVPGGSTWLIKPKIDAEIRDIQLRGVEGTPSFITKKGAYISFTSSIASSYQLTISSSSDQHPFTERHLIVNAQAGEDNRFYWDGLDSDGNLVPVGEAYPIEIEVKALGGEIHFPYFDMEINPNGIIITRMHDDLQGGTDAIVYWDDSLIPRGAPGEPSDPPVNLTRGFPSQENGHKWGSYTNQTVPSSQENANNLNYGSFSFGNEMSIDTWSYSLSISERIVPEITVRVADLEVVNITPNKTIIELEEEVTYRITVKNSGPSDANGAKFRYDLPTGFTIHSATEENSSCGQTSNLSYAQGSITADVDLENDCEIVFVITASASNVPDETYGFYPTLSSIVRPIGVTDPDATNINPNISIPTSALVECAGSPCNNILHNNSVFLLEPYNERGQLALVKSVVHIDTNDDGYHNVGEELRYTFMIKNVGEVTVRNITLTDPMLSTGNLNTGLSVLAPNESFQVVHSYQIKQEDLDREYVSNTATVHGINPRGFDVTDISGITESDDDPTVLVMYRTPHIYLKKTVTNSGTGENGQFTIGDVIQYRFEVRNDEDFPLVDAVINDPLLNPATIHVGNVDASGTTTASATYQISQSDIETGHVTNTATLTTIDQRVARPVSIYSGYEFSNSLPTVTQLAKLPRAVHDKLTQYAGSTSTTEILANDIPGSSTIEPGSITIISPPTSGTLRINQDGSVSYTPDYAFAGEDSYEYRVRDASRLWSNTATVSITVQPTIVMAQEDQFGLTYNRTLQRDVLQNDYTIGGSTIVPGSIEILRYPQHGELLSMTNGIFQYRPANNYTGYDGFTYRVMDNAGFWSEETKVTIEVTGLLVPNAITPNGDGHNDTFYIIGTYAYERVQVEIIDRFGNLLYRSDNYQNDWAAENIADGTYYYIVQGFKEGKQTLYEKGAVSVIRRIMIR